LTASQEEQILCACKSMLFKLYFMQIMTKIGDFLTKLHQKNAPETLEDFHGFWVGIHPDSKAKFSTKNFFKTPKITGSISQES